MWGADHGVLGALLREVYLLLHHAPWGGAWAARQLRPEVGLCTPRRAYASRGGPMHPEVVMWGYFLGADHGVLGALLREVHLLLHQRVVLLLHCVWC